MAPQSPYATVSVYARPFPTHVLQSAEEDRQRLRAYDTYEDLYRNQSEVFAVAMNVDGENELLRRLIPTARTIVEATNRYLARGLSWAGTMTAPTTATDAGGTGDSAAADAATAEAVGATMAQLKSLFDREEFGAKFLSLKRWMLIRGDAMLHITADQAKPEGKRISITELNPGTYFAIKDPANAERVNGCYIVNIIKDDEDEDIAARLEYQRILTPEDQAKFNGAPLNTIFVRMSFWEPDGWDDRATDEDLKPVDAPARFGESFALLLQGTTLPADITAIPVYHFRNNRNGSEVFGISEIQGIETLINGINQTATDQEIAVALQGLGVYWTDSGKPVDDDGNPTDWVISPATMLTVQEGRSVGRVQGVGSVQPSLDHIKFLKGEQSETTGTPLISIGTLESATASSGVALSIEMAPILAKNEEKEEEINSKLVQMLFDLVTGWLPAYEGLQDNGVRVAPSFEDPVPVNEEAEIKKFTDLVTAKVISTRFARTMLAERLGWQIPADEESALAGEAQASADLMGARLDAEVAAAAPAEAPAQEA